MISFATFLSVYAPTLTSNQEDITKFYQDLREVILSTPRTINLSFLVTSMLEWVQIMKSGIVLGSSVLVR
jgi:hypothetical protein